MEDEVQFLGSDGMAFREEIGLYQTFTTEYTLSSLKGFSFIFLTMWLAQHSLSCFCATKPYITNYYKDKYTSFVTPP